MEKRDLRAHVDKFGVGTVAPLYAILWRAACPVLGAPPTNDHTGAREQPAIAQARQRREREKARLIAGTPHSKSHQPDLSRVCRWIVLVGWLLGCSLLVSALALHLQPQRTSTGQHEEWKPIATVRSAEAETNNEHSRVIVCSLP